MNFRLTEYERREHLSFKRLKGYFDPGGNSGGGSAVVTLEIPGCNGDLSDLEEFPALPDLIMPFLGGIHRCRPLDPRLVRNNCEFLRLQKEQRNSGRSTAYWVVLITSTTMGIAIWHRDSLAAYFLLDIICYLDSQQSPTQVYIAPDWIVLPSDMLRCHFDPLHRVSAPELMIKTTSSNQSRIYKSSCFRSCYF
jgi:hypothetical protein